MTSSRLGHIGAWIDSYFININCIENLYFNLRPFFAKCFFARITTSWLLFRKLVAVLTFVLSNKTYSVAHKSLAERHPLKGSTIHWKWTMATTYREPFILLPVFESQVQFYPSPELKHKQYPLLMSVFELNMVEKQTNWYFNKINTAKPLSIWRQKKIENKNIVRSRNK